MDLTDYETTYAGSSPKGSIDWRERRPSSEQAMEVNCVLIRDIPKLKYHDEPLRFVSEPGISQKKYERRILLAR